MKYITGFLAFWYDFVVGDAWEVAVGVVVALAVGAFVIQAQPALSEAVGFVIVAVIVAVLGGSLWWEQKGRRFS